MSKNPSVNLFFSAGKIAVAGVSRTQRKFGNTIYKELQKRGFEVVPVHPHMDDYLGQKCYHALDELPADVSAIVINTKNDITQQLLREAKQTGIRNIWLQQGCIDKKSLSSFLDDDLNIISGQCVLMHAGEVKGIHAFHRWINKTFGTLPE